jgi:hypothetical protein
MNFSDAYFRLFGTLKNILKHFTIFRIFRYKFLSLGFILLRQLFQLMPCLF